MAEIMLDPRTRAAMAAAFAGQLCSGCEREAARFFGKAYWCHDCFWERFGHWKQVGGERRQGVEIKVIHDPDEFRQARRVL